MEKDEICILLKKFGMDAFTNDADLEEIKNAVDRFRANPYWDAEYKACPNDLLLCNEIMTYADSLSLEEVRKYSPARKKLEDMFTEFEWHYLLEHTPNQMAKWQYKIRLQQLKK